MQTIALGKWNTLKVLREVEFGVYLEGDISGDILLPRRYVPENCQVDDILDVFVYLDSEDRVIASTDRPYATVGEFAFLKVVATSSVGAFLDWGLPKDILVPFSEQAQRMVQGRSYIVYLYIDPLTDRIVASAKLDKFFSEADDSIFAGQQVDLLISGKTELGYLAIINNTFKGMVFEAEIFQPLKTGQLLKGFIKKIRDDKKIDLQLQKPGFARVDDLSETIVKYINDQGGFVPLTDKTAPTVIYNLFGVSKKTFKKALGTLYKKKMIDIESEGIRLAETVRGKS